MCVAMQMKEIKSDCKTVEQLRELVRLQGDKIQRLTKENGELRHHLEVVTDERTIRSTETN